MNQNIINFANTFLGGQNRGVLNAVVEYSNVESDDYEEEDVLSAMNSW